MRNTYQSGTEANYIMEDGIEAERTLDEAKSAYEDVIERAAGQVDELEDAVQEAESERDDILERLDEKETIAAKRYLEILIEVRKVIDAGINQLRAEFNVAETSVDSSAGDSGDGGIKDPDDENGGQPVTTRL
jgi:hypothetical protein